MYVYTGQNICFATTGSHMFMELHKLHQTLRINHGRDEVKKEPDTAISTITVPQGNPRCYLKYIM